MELKNLGTEVVTSENFKELTFGIKDKDVGLILDILRSKMYQNPIQAIVREIISNARDANREVGKEKVPVVVETIEKAGSFSISFKDSGPGISEERVADIFINYGSSTKRDDNTQTGGFGLGAKTPFAYTDSFTISTIVNKTKYVYISAIDETKKGKLYLISKEACDEENGTSVIIPIEKRNRSNFETYVKEITEFWDPLPVLLNFEGKREIKKSKIFDTAICAFSSSSYNDTHLLVDSIPYYVPSDIRYDLKISNLNIFLLFKTGELELSATRESVKDSESNKKKIKERFAATLSLFESSLNEYITNSQNLLEAVIRYSKTREYTLVEENIEKFSELEIYRGLRSTLERNNIKNTFIYNNKNLKDLQLKSLQGFVYFRATDHQKAHKQFFANSFASFTQNIYFIDKAYMYTEKNATIFKTAPYFTALVPEKNKEGEEDLKLLKELGVKFNLYSEVKGTYNYNTNSPTKKDPVVLLSSYTLESHAYRISKFRTTYNRDTKQINTTDRKIYYSIRAKEQMTSCPTIEEAIVTRITDNCVIYVEKEDKVKGLIEPVSDFIKNNPTEVIKFGTLLSDTFSEVAGNSYLLKLDILKDKKEIFDKYRNLKSNSCSCTNNNKYVNKELIELEKEIRNVKQKYRLLKVVGKYDFENKEVIDEFNKYIKLMG